MYTYFSRLPNEINAPSNSSRAKRTAKKVAAASEQKKMRYLSKLGGGWALAQKWHLLVVLRYNYTHFLIEQIKLCANIHRRILLLLERTARKIKQT